MNHKYKNEKLAQQFLQIGDVVEIKNGMFVEVAGLDNLDLNNMEWTTLKIGNLVNNIDTSIFQGDYVVVFTNSSTLGKFVKCKKLNNGEFDPDGSIIAFYQTKGFVTTMTPLDVQPIRKICLPY